MRRSELVGLNVGDVTVNAGGGVLLAVRKSKSDQTGQGESVCLAELTRSGVPVGCIVRRHLERRRLERRLVELAGSTEQPLLVLEGKGGALSW